VIAPLGTAIRAPPTAARTFADSTRIADTRARGAEAGFRSAAGAGEAGAEGACTEVSPGGFPDSALLPPIANTCSCDARPPFDEVGVPPTVIATNSLPPEVKIVGPAAIWRPVWNVQMPNVWDYFGNVVYFPTGATGRRLATYITAGAGMISLQSRQPTKPFGYDRDTVGFEMFSAENLGAGPACPRSFHPCS